MRFIQRLTGYSIMQALSLLASLLATVLVIRGVGITEYGDYAFYVAVGEGFKAIILLGYEQSIGLYAEKRSRNLIEQHDVLIFNSKFLVFLLLLPFLLLIQNGILQIGILLMMFSSVMDVSYLHMEHSELKRVSQTLFFTRLSYLVFVLILLGAGVSFEYYVFAFGFTNIIYSTVIANVNKKNFFPKIDLVDGARQLWIAIPMGANRIFLFNEGLFILYFFKNILASEVYGVFMFIFNIARMLTAFLSVVITPAFKNVTMQVQTKEKVYKKLFFFGFLSTCACLLSIKFLTPIALVKKIIGFSVDDKVLIVWLMYSCLYSFAIYISTIYLTIGIIAFGKVARFYFTRIFYIFIVVLCSYFLVENNPVNGIFVLITAELISVVIPSIIISMLISRDKISK
ncbi:hypothetical protein AOC21_01655 [Polynucleobacter sp. VK25]|uniref:hypothetical protein n=1 Tax=Polynucleobacter sp. VK25 TaxID=1758398 RepID=UPI001BFD4B02|nr:hypothetical protein [Polynucleobacter sp. VK25]QWD68644.1 hypothetical protein AOC21_01655 [Polynucleobacter sp. VK25]